MPRNRVTEAGKHAKAFTASTVGENDQRYRPIWLENHLMAEGVVRAASAMAALLGT